MNRHLGIPDHGSERETEYDEPALATPSLVGKVEELRAADDLERDLGTRDLPEQSTQAEQRRGGAVRSTVSQAAVDTRCAQRAFVGPMAPSSEPGDSALLRRADANLDRPAFRAPP